MTASKAANSAPDSSGGMAAVLEGVLVVAIEQAVAGPYATSRLAEAGARVLKIERPGTGDFARDYDGVAHGESAHFIWLNQGKESVALDLKNAADADLLRTILRQADVLVQNLAPGALDRMGLAPEKLRAENPRLITCSITGYGEGHEYSRMKAYDNLVQAEAGIFAVTGNGAGPAKAGVPICDIGAGMHAYLAILEALLERQRTGRGRHVAVSMFEAMADWMTVAYLFQRYAGAVTSRTGLHHASLAPYGPYAGGDSQPVMLAIQNDPEWVRLCEIVFRRPALTHDPRFATNADRIRNRDELNNAIAEIFAPLDRDQILSRLREADLAFGLIRTMPEFLLHPALAISVVDTPTGPVEMPSRAVPRTSLAQRKIVPQLGVHTSAVRREFADRRPLVESRPRNSVA